MNHFQTAAAIPSEQRQSSREGEPAWEEADGATWREVALGLVEAERSRLYEEDGWRCRSIEQYAQWAHGLTPAHTQGACASGGSCSTSPRSIAPSATGG